MLQKGEDEERMFQTVKEASEFWKLLWEHEERKWRPFGTMAGRSERGNQRECSRTQTRWIHI